MLTEFQLSAVVVVAWLLGAMTCYLFLVLPARRRAAAAFARGWAAGHQRGWMACRLGEGFTVRDVLQAQAPGPGRGSIHQRGQAVDVGLKDGSILRLERPS